MDRAPNLLARMTVAGHSGYLLAMSGATHQLGVFGESLDRACVAALQLPWVTALGDRRL